jgi:hypothetical protein
MRKFLVFLVLLLPLPAAAGIDAEFQPYVLPVAFAWSSDAGFSVRFRGPSIPVLIGHVNVGYSIGEAESRYPSKLVIVSGHETYIYDLGGRSFRLALPNNMKGKVTIAYVRGGLYVRIPHPERLGAPQWGAGDDSGGIVEGGSFTLESGQGYSFTVGKVYKYETELNLQGVSITAPYVRRIGPTRLSSVKSLPEGPGAISRFLSPALKPFQQQLGGWIAGGFFGQQVIAGYSYGIMIGPEGPYAVVQVVDVQELESEDSWRRLRVRFAYKFQRNGTPRF